MQKYWNTVTKRTGAVVSGASVTVTTYPAGGAATIYSDDGVTPAANPLTTDANGFFSFYAADGRYSIAVTGNDITPYSIDDVALIEDPADDKADIAALQADVATRALSADLASTSSGKGVALLGYSTTGETAKAALDARLPEIGTYVLLRAYSGALTSFYVRGVANIFDGGAGVFRVDASDTTSADNGGTILVDAAGRRWKREFSGAVNVLWFGADKSGVEDSASAFNTALAMAEHVCVPAGRYRAGSSISLDKGSANTKTVLTGAGLGVTVIEFDHYATGLEILGNPASLTEVHLSDFSVIRPTADAYGGVIGPKSILVRYAKNATIRRVEESGAIGFGVQFWDSQNVEVEGCYAHDHKGGSSGPTGTDGIHFYECVGARALNNVVERVGDDAISFGSLDSSNPTTDVLAVGNTVKSGGGGGVKCYAFVKRAVIRGNHVSGVINGGVYLTDDASSPANSLIENVDITDNQFVDCVGAAGNFEGGAVRMRLWNGVTTASVKNVTVKRNKMVGCRVGVMAWAYNATKRFINLAISDNEIIDPPTNLAGDNAAVRVIQCDGDLEIRGNLIVNAAAVGIDLNNVNGGYSATWDNTVVTIEDNVIDGYSMQTIGGTASRGIWLRGTGIRTICNIRNNKVLRQKSGNGITPDRAILAPTVSPLSVIEFNQTDRSGSGFQISSQAAYIGNDKQLGAAPTSGSHYDTQRYYNWTPATAQPMGWICKTAGTFGVLAGVTGTINNGERVVVVNDAANIYPGVVISVAGAVTAATVLSVSGSSVTLSAAASATVAGAAVAYVSPAFVAMANLA